jgi:hypothetical protein
MLARHAKLSAIPIIQGIEMTISPALTVRLRDRRFYLFIAVLTAAIVFAGFARTFFLNGFFAKLPLPSLYILHGLVFSSWLVLLVTQSALISAKQIRIHQKLGYASIAIVVSMFSLGWIMSVQAAQRGFTPPGGPPPLSFLAFQILGLVLFTALVIAGFLLRNRSADAQAAHGRRHGHHTYARPGAPLLAFQHPSDHFQGLGSAARNLADLHSVRFLRSQPSPSCLHLG